MIKFHIEWYYNTKQKKQLRFTSDEIEIYDVLGYIEDIEKTGRVKELKILDFDERSWSKKEIKRALSKVEEEPTKVELYFDGGFNKETQEAGLGAVIYYTLDSKRFRLRLNAKRTHVRDNNEAEYAALELGIKAIIDLNVKKQQITVKGDSKIVINELNGEWASFNDIANRYAENIERRLGMNKVTCQYHLIDRKENEEAHILATQALSGIFIEGKKEIANE